MTPFLFVENRKQITNKLKLKNFSNQHNGKNDRVQFLTVPPFCPSKYLSTFLPEPLPALNIPTGINTTLDLAHNNLYIDTFCRVIFQEAFKDSPLSTESRKNTLALYSQRLILTLLVTLSACLPHSPGGQAENTAPAASAFGKPLTTAKATPTASTLVKEPSIPSNFDSQRLGLADVLDAALRNNPVTKASWADAQAAAAGYGSSQAAYFPTVNMGGSIVLKETHDSNAQTRTPQQSQGPSLDLSCLLIDFGGRDATREKALQSLLAANWSHNATLQDTILAVEKAYFQYMAAKAFVVAAQADLKDSEQHLAAAEAMHQAGTATIADVLQMKTAHSLARLALQTAQGAIFTTRGALATTMGVPANIPFDIEDNPGEISPSAVGQKVDELIDTALAQRPDLAAAQARYLASVAQTEKIRADGSPTLSLVSTATATWFQVDTAAANGPFDRREDIYTAGLILRVPLFTGYANTYDLAKANAEAQGQAERNNAMEQQVVLQVFQSYYSLQTAIENVRVVEDLFASAQQSAAVAAERYKEGVGTGLEVVSTQSDLAAARSQKVQAGWQWRTAVAQLAHDTGMLGLNGEAYYSVGTKPKK